MKSGTWICASCKREVSDFRRYWLRCGDGFRHPCCNTCYQPVRRGGLLPGAKAARQALREMAILRERRKGHGYRTIARRLGLSAWAVRKVTEKKAAST